MIRYILLTFILISPAFADQYWIDDNGEANWADAKSSTPLSGTSCTTISQLNSNIVAGDTAWFRSGTYTTGIEPTGIVQGKADSVILLKSYTGEMAAISDSNIYGILLQGDDYFKIDSIRFTKCDKLARINLGSDYIEFENCIFDSAVSECFKMYGGGGEPDIYSQHLWIHNCTFHNSGNVNTETCDDQLHLVYYGVDGSEESTYNTFEDNILYHGGHHCFASHTKYNVIRNNITHNEGFMSSPGGCPYSPNDTDSLYGNRNFMIQNTDDNIGTFNLVENNRIGHAGRPPDDDGAHNLVVASKKNIVRYNYIFNACNDGLYLRSADSDSNKIYNNTIYLNGVNNNAQYSRRNGITIVQYSINSVFKNNISYANDNNDFSDWGDDDNTETNNWFGVNGNPIFTNTDVSDPTSSTLPDLSIGENSACIDSGTYLTQANGSGTNNDTLIVDDALYFQDGSWGSSLSSIDADWIAIGTVNDTVQIDTIYYDLKKIILSENMTWSDNASVWLYKDSDGTIVLKGSKPDIGAYEFEAAAGASGLKDDAVSIELVAN